MSEDDPLHPRPPVPLQYFGGDVPDPPLPRGVLRGWIILAIGWVPFSCGVVNVQAIVRSGVEGIIRVHITTGIALMILGAIFSALCCAAFAVQRNIASLIVAAVSLIVQVCVFFCIGGW